MTINEQLLTINEYSRPAKELHEVKGIVVHWVANPMSTAQANKDFFENRKHGGLGYGSAHYIIGLKGEIIRCIPENELSYNCGAKEYKFDALKLLGNYPNSTTIGIECCHLDWTGKMTQETYSSLIGLTLELCRKYKLNPLKQVLLHYEITGKDCHKWFVDNPAEWQNFKQAVANTMNKN